MLSDLLPMMTNTVQHWRDKSRTVFGKPKQDGDYTEHRARVALASSVETAADPRQAKADHAATLWLIDHPHPVRIGETFVLPPADELLKVVRVESRHVFPSTLTKVFLK